MAFHALVHFGDEAPTREILFVDPKPGTELIGWNVPGGWLVTQTEPRLGLDYIYEVWAERAMPTPPE